MVRALVIGAAASLVSVLAGGPLIALLQRLGLRKAISNPGEKLRPAREVEAALEGCRPYRAYAAMRLWSML